MLRVNSAARLLTTPAFSAPTIKTNKMPLSKCKGCKKGIKKDARGYVRVRGDGLCNKCFKEQSRNAAAAIAVAAAEVQEEHAVAEADDFVGAFGGFDDYQLAAPVADVPSYVARRRIWLRASFRLTTRTRQGRRVLAVGRRRRQRCCRPTRARGRRASRAL